jgi:hypothetical protein
MSSVAKGMGVALNNVASELIRVSEASGPITIVADNVGEKEVVFQVQKKSDMTNVMTDKDTAVSAENTGFTGNASTRDFTGQNLNNLPIVPGSVVIKPVTGGGTVNAVDTNGDGILYTVQTTPVVCGTVDYFTGALVLHYPVAHAPNTGVIAADYAYQDVTTKPHAIRSIAVGNLPPQEIYIVKAAAKLGSSEVRVDVLVSF